MAEESPKLTGAEKAQELLAIALIGVIAQSIGVLLYYFAYHQSDLLGLNLLLYILVAIIVVSAQIFYFARILSDWDHMTYTGRWMTGVAAFLAPPIIAVVGVALAMLVVILAGVGLLLWVAIHVVGSDAPVGSRFGSWWGDRRVINDADGRPQWVGDERVLLDNDGRPQWVGDNRVILERDGSPQWVGDNRVISDQSGRVRWVGDDQVI